MPSHSVICNSPVMQRLALLAERIAQRDVTVLLCGESGTGKERVAEGLVAASHRANQPFLRFNCAAVTTELAEAELFGHTKGAFTGAIKARAGLFREADGGTILLDEVGELAPLIQAKLLRVLQEREVRPVGEDHVFKVDVRIIAATNRDLPQLLREGRFREDLYYRLNVVQLHIPPLRERSEDVVALASHFLDRFSRRFGVGPFGLTPALLDRMARYSWPGNVRELENAIESLVALSHDELDISLMPDPTALPPAAAHLSAGSEQLEPKSPRDRRPVSFELKDRVDAYERELIADTLDASHGNRTLTARALGINRATLHGKLRKYGLVASDLLLNE